MALMTTRVAVVTGSNKGIGLGIVKELCAKFDGDVYLTSPEEELGRAAVKELEGLGLHPHYHQLDVEDESSVTRLRDHLRDTYGGLDVLVNNAGICIFPESRRSFHEKALVTLNVNFFGTCRVCDILFPILRPHSRVVNMTSSAGHLLRIPGLELRAKLGSPELSYEDLLRIMQDYIDSAGKGDQVARGWPDDPPTASESNTSVNAHPSSYVVSKVGLSALTRVQQRQFDQDPSRPDIIVNAVNPGAVCTDLSRQRGRLSIQQGSIAPCWLALLPPNVNGPKGAYVWHDKQIVDWVNGPVPDPSTYEKHFRGEVL